MNAVAVLAGAIGLVLVILAMLVMRGGSVGQMRERVRSATTVEPMVPLASETRIRIVAPDERRLLLRMAAVLGYNPELPHAYAASPMLVITAATTVGLLAYVRLELIFGWPAGVAACLVSAAGLARFLLRRKSKAYEALLFKQIPEALSLVLRAVRAGLPVGEALRGVSRDLPSPTREEFARVVGEAALGVPLGTAFANLYARTKLREYAFFAVTLGLQGQTGGNLSETLENLADLVRRRVAMAAKGRALAAEARTSAVVLAALPFVVGLVLTLISPGYLNDFVTDPRGPNLIVAFVVLLSCGLLTIRYLIDRSTQD